MVNMISMGGGSAPRIEIDVNEITTIFRQIETIKTEFESSIIPNAEKLGSCKFYRSGKAQNAMSVYREANEKMTEIYIHYERASTLVIDTLNKMMEADKKIAQQIIEKLEI